MIRRRICEICQRQNLQRRGFSTGGGGIFSPKDEDVMKSWAHLFDAPKPDESIPNNSNRLEQGQEQEDESPLASLTKVLMRESGHGKPKKDQQQQQPKQSLYDTKDIGSTWERGSVKGPTEVSSSSASAAAAGTGGGGFGPGSATQKERDIFARIFDTILSSPSGIRGSKGGGRKGGGGGGSGVKRGDSNTGEGKGNQSLNLSAVFARGGDASLSGLDPSGSSNDGGGLVSSTSVPNSGEMTLGKTLSELLKYPKSLQVPLRNSLKTTKKGLASSNGGEGVLSLSEAFGQEPLSAEQIEREKKRREEFKKIQADMDGCRTDFELEVYMKNQVLSLFGGGKKQTRGGEGMSLDNYSHALAYGIETLAWGFEAPTTAIHVFEEAKRIDIQSYLTGCTVEVYNKVLKIRWELYGDLFAVNSLIDEMEMNGIQGNDQTVDFVYETTSVITRMLEKNQRLIQGSGIDRLDYNLQGIFVWSAEDQVQLHRLQQYQISLLRRVTERNQARQQMLDNDNDDDIKDLLQL